MPEPKKRDLVKEAIRSHCSFEGPDLEEAAKQIGLGIKSLQYYQRRREWLALCRQVAEETLILAFPIAIRRLIDAARTDKSSSGVTAAKTLVDICRGEEADEMDTARDVSDGIDLEKLSKEEREFACRLLARLRGQGTPG